MRLDLSPGQQALSEAVDRVLDALPGDATDRDRFEALGRERLLAVHYPVGYGGRGLSLAGHAAVSERVGRRGLPDVVHLVTVQGVGCPILAFGDDRQRDRWLPEIAGGRLFASLLLSEVAAGSDLTRIGTTARSDGDGWRIDGVKAWTMYTDLSGLALCSTRTRAEGNRYDGISLFLVDLRAPGVEVTRMPRAAEETYYQVRLDDVRVGPEALLGRLHKGWALLPTVIGFERGGVDYLNRATAWLDAAESAYRELPVDRRATLAGDLMRLRQHVRHARVFAFHAAHTAEDLEVDELLSAYAKLMSGRAAQAVARWAGEELLSVAGDEDAPARRTLRAAVMEAPELTVSGGPQELQLDLIAAEFPMAGVFR